MSDALAFDLLGTNGQTPFSILITLSAILAAAALVLGVKGISIKSSSIPSKHVAPIKKIKNQKVCPFSQNSNFLVENAENLQPSPLDLSEDWEEKQSQKPLSARWLEAGISGQDTPGILRAGLKRLRNSRHFLVEEPSRLREELLLKKKALDNPERHPIVFVAEPDSLEAQRECLELFLDYLPKRYPDQYTFDGKSIFVKAIDTTFLIEDWWNTRPLELCERIVQEDLILMRPEENTLKEVISTDKSITESPVHSYKMAAAAVVFSFNELQEKLSKPAEFIHAPVPGFQKDIQKSVNLTFSKLQPERPMWRNNWGIAPSGTLDEPLYGSTAAHEHRIMDNVTVDDVKAKFLKVEYQTIRRFPRTGYLLFTVKTMADPMSSLESVPKGAACLAASIRGMSTAMRKYKGIENDATCEAVLSYLDSICEK